jgi:D-alanine transaminase
MHESSVVYLNGKYLPKEQACVPVMDRGFLLGDGIYEVIPVFAGKAFRLPEHLQRLQNSLDAIRIRNPFTEAEWTQLVNDIIQRNNNGDLSVYLQVTRGVVEKRDHAFSDNIKPTVFIMTSPIPEIDIENLREGHSAITVEDIRWARCDVKAITLLANLLLRQQAVEADAAEAILVKDGNAIEGAASNLFMVENGTIITPAKGKCLLPGITRDLVLEIAASHKLPHREETISLQRLRAADEIWMTSSTREILPVTELDGAPVGNGKTGPVWEKVFRLYQEFKQSLRDS